MTRFKLSCAVFCVLLILMPIVCLGNVTNSITDDKTSDFEIFAGSNTIIGAEGWYGDTNNVTAVTVNTNTLPLSATKSEVLSLEAGANILTNLFDQTSTNTWIDMLVQMNPASETPAVITNGALQAGFWLDAGSSNMMVRHAIYDTTTPFAPTSSVISDIVIPAGDWIRLSIKMEYEILGVYGYTRFQMKINGGSWITNQNAYTDETLTVKGGTYFICGDAPPQSTKGHITSLCLAGAGMFDDIRITDVDIFSAPATMYTVTVDIAAGGSISPALQTNNADTEDSEVFFSANNGFYISSIFIVGGGSFAPATNYTVSKPGIATNIHISAVFSTNETDGSISNNVPPEWMQKVANIYTNDYTNAAAADLDGDGYSTADEFLMSSDPLDSDDFLRVSSVTLDGSGNPEIQWRSNYDTNYPLPAFEVQLSTNMTGGPAWSNIAFTNRVEGSHTNVVTLPVQAETHYYYKVVATNN